ncbi:sensor histidine kinase [Nocardioides immobilis]|uniref:histidine kinase n=1 Tax=Nocardioides immobilis TaxID=2049295 RepID=A0A417Y221_9ACTN|nr:sensor histidine kinase [Nocardioides immobilis]RHW26635.1 sensor histidine kinase [Nocardioides immobilis]
MTISRTSRVDAVLAAALLAAGQVDVWTTGGVDGRRAAAIAVLATAPLAWRSRAPITVVLVGVGALTLLTARGEDQFTVAQLLGLMLATYTVSALRPARTAALCVTAVVFAALTNSAAAGSRTPGDYVFPLILLGVPAAAGASLRQWRRRSEELRQLTEELLAEREAHAKLVVAAERGRIARDLHDSLAQSLSAVVLHAEAGEGALGRDDERVATSLARIQEVGRSSLAETRQILGALRQEDDAVGQPRLDQLDQLLQRYRAAGLSVALDATADRTPVSSAVEAAAYRIVQESLTNVLRHSSCRQASVMVRGGDGLEIEVCDAGPGAYDDGGPAGFGLLGMRERAELLGGELVAGPHGSGWRVRARLPREVGR